MKKTTKGALAAGTAAVLLLGGAGSLAYWTDTATTDGTTIQSGHLKLTDQDCDGGWKLDGDTAYANQLLVPGDSLTQTCTYRVSVAGEHLKTVDFAVTAPTDVTGAQALVDEIGVTTSVELDGEPQGTATGVDVTDGELVEITMTIDWPYGALDNDSNVLGGLSATLAALSVTVTQNHTA
ncbi:alternate-type signal peptide domain-containing protein [Nocardioides zeae]|uniref:Alternate-type signal peptide domain-containing protein n=1 Tax=Nocardioides imazamoxiresistens TaxID=3231893 RepID=A0ABU3PTG2_9ACTN|nr:alternate-type signal peptide domain-containing protein [Nocardioides zeae]MDT9592522.1 alternate-type signal peptide domain-containing protein [Nocardioides zeae]